MPNPQIPNSVVNILDRLKKSGHQAYIVGGAVRDMCLCRPVTDWDVATSACPQEIRALFHDIRHFVLKECTITLVTEGGHFEVSAFKGTRNRIQDDLAYRDFTINAMAYDPETDEILDSYGGQKDLARKRITATCDARARLVEDPVRLMRAARFAAELGFDIHPETRKIMAQTAPILAGVPAERVRDELVKTLMSPRPSRGLNIMRQTGLFKAFLPELLEGYLKQQGGHHHHTIFRHILETVDQVKADPVLRLTALFHDMAKPRVRKKIHGKWCFYGHEEAGADLCEQIMERLRFSKDLTQKVTHLVRHHMIQYQTEWTGAAIRRLMRRVGTDLMMDLLEFRRADISAHESDADAGLRLLDELRERISRSTQKQEPTQIRNLAIDGLKVMEILGMPQGPVIGKILNNLLDMVTDNPDLNTEKGLVGALMQMEIGPAKRFFCK
jgi:tRNA nucleotidyltransferase (CCA-adding enzyme)